MRILHTTKEEMRSWGYGAVEEMNRHDIVVVDGVIVKYRQGTHGGRPGDAVLLDCEEEFIGAFSSVVRASHS